MFLPINYFFLKKLLFFINLGYNEYGDCMKLEYIILFIIFLIILLAVIKVNIKDVKLDFNKLVDYLGGKENIIDTETNLSRFIVTLKNINIVDKESIMGLGATGIVEVDNQLKIILGPQSSQLKKYIQDMK